MSHAGKVDPIHMLALEVACVPPPVPYHNAHTAYVPWSLIEDIRRAFEAKGVDWRSIRSPVRIQRQNRQAHWMRDRIEADIRAGRHCPDCMGRKGKHFPGCKAGRK